MVFCDHKRRIRHYIAGFPGSAYDKRDFKASKPATNPAAYCTLLQESSIVLEIKYLKTLRSWFVPLRNQKGGQFQFNTKGLMRNWQAYASLFLNIVLDFLREDSLGFVQSA
jgi:hypothetical protein